MWNIWILSIKKIAQRGWLMRFLVFPSSVKKEMPKKKCSISVYFCICHPSSQWTLILGFLFAPHNLPLMNKTEGWGTQAGLAWESRGVRGRVRSPGEGVWVSICSMFMTLHKSPREWWQTPQTGCQETSSPAVARLLTCCVALGRSRLLSFSFLICQTRLTGSDGPSALKCCDQIPFPKPWSCRGNSCSEQRSCSNLNFLLETEILNPAVTGRHF